MTSFGESLKRARTAGRFSQLQLAAAAGVSQRHLSFLETGRAKPSREMVTHLAASLELPNRHTNELLVSAGFAPRFSESSLDGDALAHIRTTIEWLLEAHNPYPAIVIDRGWDVVLSNTAATRLTAALIDPANAPVEQGVNLARLAFHPEGLRTVTVDWHRTAAALLGRLHKELEHHIGDPVLSDLYSEVTAYPGVEELMSVEQPMTVDDLLLPVHYRTDEIELRLFSTIATIGSAYDVTLEELRIETFFPVDEASRAVLDELARG